LKRKEEGREKKENHKDTEVSAEEDRKKGKENHKDIKNPESVNKKREYSFLLFLTRFFSVCSVP
jgi:hypothetical protein